MTTERDQKLAEAFREAVRSFRKAHSVSQATVLDMLLGTVAGSACRFGETREAFGARVLDAYDTLALLIDGPTGIYGLHHPEYRAKQNGQRPYLIDAEGSVVEELWNGAEWADSPQRPVGFGCALAGGHELRVMIPGVGTVDDSDALPLWREMADRLTQIAKSFGSRADAMEREREGLDHG